jgi:predicted phosphate transport protein (TIGR00153 family)
MKLDDLLKYFVPKETAFFPLFDEDAKILIKGSDLLKDLVSTTDLDDRDAFIARIKATEKEGDRLTTKIFEQLNKSFITPFDREDIQSLASSIDDVLDNINAASQRIRLYKPKFLTPEMFNVAEMIGLVALQIEIAVNGLSHPGKNRDKIMNACDEINVLENKADHIYNLAISKLFEEEKDTIELIKIKEIHQSLEKAVDKAEDVSDVIRTIMVKLA